MYQGRFSKMLDESEHEFPPELERLAGNILACGRQVYRDLGAGLLESSYHKAMEIALGDAGISYESKPKIEGVFRGRSLGVVCQPDLIVEDRIVLELKASTEMHPAYLAQLVTYLRHARKPLGFVINFHMPTLSAGTKRRVMSRFL